MEYSEIKPLIDVYHRKIMTTNLTFKRYLYSKINWNVRLLGIKGARGVGKTTLILQYIKENFSNIDDALYVSLDNLWFNNNKLEDLIEYLYSRGINHIFLDEVHKYPNWAIVIKNLYDNYPNLNIVYTGSAMLAIDNSKTDLSRRQTVYTLNGLSFREYLEYEGIMQINPITLEELLSNHIKISMDICSRTVILKHFDNYLQKGYYPYYKETADDYHYRISEVTNLIIESDLPSVEEVTFSTIQKTKKLLMVIAQNVPLEPNIAKLNAQLETTRDQCLKMLYVLDRAHLLLLLSDKIKDYKHLTNPKKIYLNNCNLMYSLSPNNISEGNKRETFFANQLSNIANISIPKKGDFFVDDKFLFEVGGSGKTFDQIANIPNSYLAIADIEIGSGNRIPLWAFGLLY